MRVIFAGTPDFAIPTLERLIGSGHDVVAVITQPDKKAGRGRKKKSGPVKIAAEKNDIPVLQPSRLKEPGAAEKIRKYDPDVIVVAAYGKIIPPSILDIPKYGCINVHASLLPKYRGAAPIQRAIMNRDTQTGVTIMKMDETLDTGDILKKEPVDILEDDDALSVHNMLSVVGAELLIDTLNEIEKSGEVKGIPQDNSEATYAAKIEKEDRYIDWTESFETVLCKIRAMSPYPGAISVLGDKEIKIMRAQPFFITEKLYRELVKNEKYPPGSVVMIRKGEGPLVKANGGLILLTEVKPPGKRAMSGVDFVNGGYVAQWDRLK